MWKPWKGWKKNFLSFFHAQIQEGNLGWKEKDGRNSSALHPENVFRSRSKRERRGREGVWGRGVLPHRSDTSRGHLHPRRVATPRPFPSRRPFFPDLPFLSISRPISSIQRGCFSPVRPLMPPLSREGRGALARKPPFFSSQASLLPQVPTHPPPAIFNPPFPSSLLPLLSALFSLVRLTEADATIVPARQISRLFRNTISKELFL